MKIFIVLHGGLKNKVIEREITEESLLTTIHFISEHGLFEHDAWYPPSRIKEVKYDKSMSLRRPKLMWVPSNIDDKKLESAREFNHPVE